ncbi:hypothetical protein CM49_04395 [Paenibacillus sp. P1XP2]|nr:hypothetical protein CM49_04395 [Paenibacillus sp. P1XP2]
MIIFLSVIAGISFAGTIAEQDSNKEASRNYSYICIAAIFAMTVITLSHN